MSNLINLVDLSLDLTNNYIDNVGFEVILNELEELNGEIRLDIRENYDIVEAESLVENLDDNIEVLYDMRFEGSW